MNSRDEYLPPEPESPPDHAVSDSAPDIEAAVLGILMNEAQHAPTLIRRVPVFFFADLRHKEIYRAIQSLILSDAYPDPLLVMQWLKEQGRMESAGGITYVSALPDSVPPAAATFEHYLEKLKEKANCRRPS